jgi:hypothetical protein
MTMTRYLDLERNDPEGTLILLVAMRTYCNQRGQSNEVRRINQFFEFYDLPKDAIQRLEFKALGCKLVVFPGMVWELMCELDAWELDHLAPIKVEVVERPVLAIGMTTGAETVDCELIE